MKSIVRVFLTIGFLVFVGAVVIMLVYEQNKVVVLTGNSAMQPLKIPFGSIQDSDCGMTIESQEYASQVINKDGNTWFFHDHGGMAKWLHERNFKDDVVIWVWAKDTNRWIDGKKAWYSLVDATPMGYGFGAYEMRHNDFIDFTTMQLKMLRGENLTNPAVAKSLGVK